MYDRVYGIPNSVFNSSKTRSLLGLISIVRATSCAGPALEVTLLCSTGLIMRFVRLIRLVETGAVSAGGSEVGAGFGGASEVGRAAAGFPIGDGFLQVEWCFLSHLRAALCAFLRLSLLTFPSTLPTVFPSFMYSTT